MKALAPAAPRAQGQTWHIAVGDHTGHLEHPEALAVQVHVTTSLEGAGDIELDIRETADPRRIRMGEAEAEALAHVFSRMQGADGKRIAHALLDAAHLARVAQGQSSSRTPLEVLE